MRMARLRERTSVDLPIELTRAGLERFFASLRQKDGTSRIRLRVLTDGPTLGLSIDRAVRIQAYPAADGDSICVTWAPEGTTVFPTFEGSLAIAADGNPNATFIELDGSYDPPFGAAGQIFDAAIGQRIAQATAREFLKDLKDAVER
jgi:hypothetical protein